MLNQEDFSWIEDQANYTMGLLQYFHEHPEDDDAYIDFLHRCLDFKTFFASHYPEIHQTANKYKKDIKKAV